MHVVPSVDAERRGIEIVDDVVNWIPVLVRRREHRPTRFGHTQLVQQSRGWRADGTPTHHDRQILFELLGGVGGHFEVGRGRAGSQATWIELPEHGFMANVA
jgi:hypothetical protein